MGYSSLSLGHLLFEFRILGATILPLNSANFIDYRPNAHCRLDILQERGHARIAKWAFPSWVSPDATDLRMMQLDCDKSL